MSYINEFPSSYVPSDLQSHIIKEIEIAIKDKGFKKIIICAPTGSGKSHIAVTIAKVFKSSIIVTAQKILQDQYVDDFSWIYPMKGKGNFPCLALYDTQKISYEEAQINKSLSCEQGNCSWIINENGKTRTEYCKFYPDLIQFEIKNKGTEQENVISPKNMCYYYEQKYASLLSSHSIFNYYSFFQTKRFNTGFERLLEKNCIIFDEAHEIEEQMINFIGFKITKSYLDEINFKFSDYDLGKKSEILCLLEQLSNAYHKKILKIENTDPENSRLSSLKNKVQKIDGIVFQLKESFEYFVVDVLKDKSENVYGISIIPLEIANYVKEFFNYPIQIFLSATINKEMFCKTMGFSESDCYFIEVSKSPFPPENRKIKFLDIASLSNKPPRSEWEKIYLKIHEIMLEYPNEKGLILTSSKDQCAEIFSNVPENSSLRLSILHNDIEDKKEQVLLDHENTESNVLLSPSLWYGVDLKDNLSRFEIIVKTPFPYLGEKRTKIKKKNDPLWYNYATVIKLLQGFGRSVRNKNDYATTYVLDTDAKNLLNSMKKYVPLAYYDVLGWE